MALAALRGVRSPGHQRGLAVARRFLGECRSADALNWLRLGLLAHGQLPAGYCHPFGDRRAHASGYVAGTARRRGRKRAGLLIGLIHAPNNEKAAKKPVGRRKRLPHRAAPSAPDPLVGSSCVRAGRARGSSPGQGARPTESPQAAEGWRVAVAQSVSSSLLTRREWLAASPGPRCSPAAARRGRSFRRSSQLCARRPTTSDL